MADLTSGLTSALFSPYSKMFIGGLSWQTSPGKRPMFRCHMRAFVGLCVVFLSLYPAWRALCGICSVIWSPLFDPC